MNRLFDADVGDLVRVKCFSHYMHVLYDYPFAILVGLKRECAGMSMSLMLLEPRGSIVSIYFTRTTNDVIDVICRRVAEREMDHEACDV